MKSLVTVLLVIVAVSAANAKVITWQTGAIANMNDNAAYAWNITYTLASNETVTGASLQIVSLQDNPYESGDKFYTNLLNDHVSATDGWVYAGGDTDPYYVLGTWVGVGDYFSDSANRPLLGTYTPTGTSRVTLTYDLISQGFGATLTSFMSDGQFGLGFDPDCTWNTSNIIFVLTTTTVPEPATFILLGLGAAITRKFRV